MSSDLAILTVNLGVVAALFGAGIAVDRRLRADARRRALSPRARLVHAFAAFGPFTYLLRNQVSLGPVDGTVVAFAVFLGLWLGLPVVATSLLGVDPAPPAECRSLPDRVRAALGRLPWPTR